MALKTSENCLFIESVDSNLDFFGQLSINCDDEEFLKHWKHFEKYYTLIPERKEEQSYGRHYIRRHMLKVKAVLTFVTIALVVQDGEDKFDMQEYEGVLPSRPLVEWSFEDWASLRDNLELIQKLILRQDVAASINQEENATPDAERSQAQEYSGDKLFRLISMHQTLCPIRDILEEHIANEGMQEWKPELDQSLVQKFIENWENLEDKIVQKYLFDTLLVKKGPSTLLKDLSDVRNSIDLYNGGFAFSTLLKRISKDFKAWSVLFPTPKLDQFHFPNADTLENLQEKPADLNGGVVEGAVPIYEASTAAATEQSSSPAKVKTRRSSEKKRPRGGQLLSKKESASALTFDDSEDENLSFPDENAGLSDLPKQHTRVKRRSSVGTPSKRRRTQIKCYDGRRRWSDDEKNAIKEGVKEFGVGNWAQTKEKYSALLDERTSGQIKDCFRTMKRRGEFHDMQAYLQG